MSPWIFWPTTRHPRIPWDDPTFCSSMNVPEETFFRAPARLAPGCSVLYRWIVLSARRSYKISVWLYLGILDDVSHSGIEMSQLPDLTHFYLIHLCERSLARMGICTHLEMRTFVVTDREWSSTRLHNSVEWLQISRWKYCTAAKFQISSCKIRYVGREYWWICENAFVPVSRKKELLKRCE